MRRVEGHDVARLQPSDGLGPEETRGQAGLLARRHGKLQRLGAAALVGHRRLRFGLGEQQWPHLVLEVAVEDAVGLVVFAAVEHVERAFHRVVRIQRRAEDVHRAAARRGQRRQRVFRRAAQQRSERHGDVARAVEELLGQLGLIGAVELGAAVLGLEQRAVVVHVLATARAAGALRWECFLAVTAQAHSRLEDGRLLELLEWLLLELLVLGISLGICLGRGVASWIAFRKGEGAACALFGLLLQLVCLACAEDVEC